MPHAKELTGQRFGRLVVAWPVGILGRRIKWMCFCDCGRFVAVSLSNLSTKHVQSCGCLRKELCTKHGAHKSVEYKAYTAAKYRCENPKDGNYRNYGARGIQFRFKSFTEFLLAVGPRPQSHLSIDRINNNGHYEPGNVRWATYSEQNRNKRRKNEWGN